jgi:DNA-binding GntR family transcriptional regulator
VVDLESPVPLYVQLADIIREQIRKKELSGRVPSVRSLAQEYGIAQVTVVKSMEILKAEGLIVTVRGKGTYVNRQQLFRHPAIPDRGS